MIFKKLFSKKKWQSNKISDRISSISELETSNSEQKSILHELAFNDADKTVRRAALEKLNDFSLFWQAAKKEADEDVNRFALNQIKKALTSNSNDLASDSEKLNFIKECSNSQLINDIKYQLPTTELIEAALQRINKQESFIEALILGHLSDQTSLKTIQMLDDVNALKKLQKKLKGTNLAEVESKLAVIQQHAEALSQADKKARLTLAQLNALKDKSDFVEISSQYSELTRTWNELSPLVLELDSHISTELTGKFQKLDEALKIKLSTLESAYLDIKERSEKEESKKRVTEELTSDLENFERNLNNLVENDGEIELGMTQTLEDISNRVEQAEINEASKSLITTRVEKLQRNLIDLPKIKAAQNQAQELIKQLQEMTPPDTVIALNDFNPQLKSVKSQWAELESKALLNSEKRREFKELVSNLTSAVKKLETEQNKKFSSFKRKQSELSQLITDGKYREAFGLFYKLESWYAELNDYQQSKIEKSWQESAAEVGKLKDLEQSIAAPKRQELLTQIEQLASKPLVDPSEQAHRVKVLRSDWLSLGRLEKDDPLNEQFNLASEKAFEVCRAFYSELEAERDKAYQAKILIIEQLEILAQKLQSEAVSSWKDVEQLNNKLTKLWFDTGLIDKSKVAETNKRFSESSKLIKAKIAEQHKNNRALKSTLLEKATEIAKSEQTLADKANHLKKLQADWKLIGFSGRKVDDQLWTDFRKVNNAVFDDLGASRNESRDKSAELRKGLLEAIQGYQDKLTAIDNNKDLRELEAEAKSLRIERSELERSDFDKVSKAQKALLDKLSNSEIEIRDANRVNQYKQLFDGLEDLANGNTIDNSVLKTSWANALNANTKVDRLETTIKLEIMSDLESPEQDNNTRKAVQMSMMTDKLESGVTYNQEELLEDWLSAGAVSKEDVDLVNRIRKVFLK